MTDEHLQKYVEYIRNTGRAPLPTVMFDEDWEPVGPSVRKQLMVAGLTDEDRGHMILLSPETK